RPRAQASSVSSGPPDATRRRRQDDGLGMQHILRPRRPFPDHRYIEFGILPHCPQRLCSRLIRVVWHGSGDIHFSTGQLSNTPREHYTELVSGPVFTVLKYSRARLELYKISIRPVRTGTAIHGRAL
ncbi:hypothetical protein BGX29_004248, partial [Mortierella sp. GBA35]